MRCRRHGALLRPVTHFPTLLRGLSHLTSTPILLLPGVSQLSGSEADSSMRAGLKLRTQSWMAGSSPG